MLQMLCIIAIKDKKGVRIGHKLLDNGKKVRICKKCGEVLDK